MQSIQVLLPYLKLAGHHKYCAALFNEFADLQFRWPRGLALNAVAHSCVDFGGGAGEFAHSLFVHSREWWHRFIRARRRVLGETNDCRQRPCAV